MPASRFMDRTNGPRSGRSRRGRRWILERLEERSLLSADFSAAVGVGGANVLASAVVEDAAGNAVVAGSFQGTVDFDPGAGVVALSAGGTQAAFVAMYGPAGSLIWARAFAQSGGTSGQAAAVALGGGGAVYVGGGFAGTADFDPGPGTASLTSAGGQDAFLVKLDAAGNLVWARRWGGAGNDAAAALAVDAGGRVGVVGSFTGTVDLDPGAGVDSHDSAGMEDVSAQVFDASGGLQWARTVGGTITDAGTAAAFDAAGNLFVGGSFQSTADFDPGPGTTSLTSAGGQDAFLMKLDSAGGLVWARGWGNGFADGVAALASDGTNIIATGSFAGTLDIDPGSGVTNLTSTGFADAYAVKLTAAGALAWSASFGGTAADFAGAVAADAAGNVYLAGGFQGAVDFAPGPGEVELTSFGDYDGYVVKLDAAGNYFWARQVGGVGYDAAAALAVNAGGTLALAGRYTGPAAFGSLNLASAGTVSLFLAVLPDSPNPAPPSAPDLEPNRDSGRSDADEITSAGAPVFLVATAGASNTVELYRDDVKVDTRVGPGTLTDAAVPEGTYRYTARQVDGLQRSSDASPALEVTIDRTAPAAPAAPALNPADDAGTVGDSVTDLTQPALAGTAEPGALVEILNSNGVVVGSALADAGGGYLARFDSPLALGSYSVRVRATDAAGNVSSASDSLVLTIAADAPGETQDFLTTLGIGGASVLTGALTTDGAGNLVVAGTFQGTVDFDPGAGTVNLRAGGTQAAFVALYDPAGGLIWARGFTQIASTSGQARGVAVGTDGTVYVAGNFTGTIDTDPGDGTANLTSAGGTDAFLIALSATGDLSWARRWGGTGADTATGLTALASGGIAVAGSFTGTIDVDPGAGTDLRASIGGTDVLVQRFSATGALSWARTAGGGSGDTATAISHDDTGAIVVGGSFIGTVDFDPGPTDLSLTSTGGPDAFVWKLSGAGDSVWAARWGNNFTDSVVGLSGTTGGGVVAVGNFQGTLDFAPAPGVPSLTSQGVDDAAVVSFDSAGGIAWAVSFGGPRSDFASGVAADSSGNVYLSGSFQETVDFAPGAGVVALTSAGGYDGFAVKLDAGGGYQWARQVGGIGYDAAAAVAVVNDGVMGISGRYTGPATFGTSTLASAGTVSLFLARIGVETGPPAPTVALANDTGGSATDRLTTDGALAVGGLAPGASAEYSVDGGASWSASFAAVEGANSVRVRQVDAQGLPSAASDALLFTLDTSAPVIFNLAAAPDPFSPNGDGTLETVAISAVVTEPNPAGWTLAILNSGGATVRTAAGAGGSVGFTWDGRNAQGAAVADGTYTYRIDAVDQAGNPAASRTGQLTLDTTPPPAPAAPVLTPASDTGDSSGDGITRETRPTFRGSGVAPGAVVTILRDGTAVATGTAADFTTTGLRVPDAWSDGSYQVRVTATDGAGNISVPSLALSVTIDTAAPETVLDGGPASVTTSTDATFTFHATEPPSRFLSILDGGPPSAATSPLALSGLALGTHTLTVWAIDPAGNEEASPVSFTWTINGPIALAVSDASGTYGGTTTLQARLTREGSPLSGRDLVFTLNGVPAGTVATDADGVALLGSVSLAGLDAGSYPGAVDVRFAGGGGDPASIGAAALSIARATPAVTWNDPAAITYGTILSALQLNAAANVPGAFDYGTLPGRVLDAGTGQVLNVTFTPTDTTNYDSASRTVQIDVRPAALMIRADDLSRPYGQANPTLTGTLTGVAAGDLILPRYATTATASSPVGLYDIVPSLSDPDQRLVNYTVTVVNGGLTVAKAHLRVIADDQEKTYDGTASSSAGFTVRYEGLAPGETAAVLTGAPELGGAAVGAVGAGTYAIVPTIGTLAALNYDFTGFTPGSLTIRRARLSVAADSKTMTYGDAPPALTAAITGFVPGEDAGVLTGSPALTSAVLATSHVGAYPIQAAAGTLAAANYELIFTPGVVTVTPALLTIRAPSLVKRYGEALPAIALEYQGFRNGDTPASLAIPPAVVTAATAASLPGSYPIEVGGASSADYTISFQPGRLTVEAPPPVVILQTEQVTHRVKRRKVTFVVVTFSAALDAASAQGPGNFRMVAAGRDRRFGTRDDAITRFKAAVYDPAAHTVSLTPTRKLRRFATQRLGIAGVLDTLGRAVDGDADGLPGGSPAPVVSRPTRTRGVPGGPMRRAGSR